MRLLCLSNGHGEDAIALRILQALQQQPHAPAIEALPIVGEGHAYIKAEIPLIGSVKTMPSGGFIYMDGRQLARDIGGGLVQLTLAQIKAVRAWAAGEGGTGDGVQGTEYSQFKTQNSKLKTQNSTSSLHTPSPSLILAVGDIVPLLFAWLSGVPYAFIGTAKSEYYLRDEAGWLPRKSWWSDRLQRWTGCVYHPWERWLMSRPNCKAVFPRDSITAKVLKQYGVPAFNLGNPMMDGLEWRDGGWGMGDEEKESGVRSQESEADADFGVSAQSNETRKHGDTEDSKFKIQNSKLTQNLKLKTQNSPSPSLLPHLSSLTIALLPGSRPPEAYANWETLLLAVNGLVAKMNRPLELLAAIAPNLDLEILHQMLLGFRWQQISEATYTVGLGEKQATLVLAQNCFTEFVQRADLAIAMAGTATEQFVGLGKPAITLPGKGPQFTPAFAEAQTRLLGPSVTLVTEPAQVATAIQSLLSNPDRLQLIAENGPLRMGTPGAAERIAQCLVQVVGDR
jgi:hypothetical protein